MYVMQIVPLEPYILAYLTVIITKPYKRQTQWFLITTPLPVGYVRNRIDVVGWSVLVSNSDRGKKFLCSAKVQNGSETHSGYNRENAPSTIITNVYYMYGKFSYNMLRPKRTIIW